MWAEFRGGTRNLKTTSSLKRCPGHRGFNGTRFSLTTASDLNYSSLQTKLLKGYMLLTHGIATSSGKIRFQRLGFLIHLNDDPTS